MTNKIAVILIVSLVLNTIFLSLGALFFTRKGLFTYLKKEIFAILNKQTVKSAFYCSPHYLHRKSLFETLAHTSSEVIFLGDSITEECEWAELLESPHVKNRGISGDTTTGVLHRLSQIVELKPRKIFLMVGINNFISLSMSVKEVAEEYRKILLEIQNATPNTKVYIQSVLIVNNSQMFWARNEKVLELNLQLNKLAHEFSFQYLDLTTHLADSQNQLNAMYTSDGLHLNGQAYLVWKEVIKKHVFDYN